MMGGAQLNVTVPYSPDYDFQNQKGGKLNGNHIICDLFIPLEDIIDETYYYFKIYIYSSSESQQFDIMMRDVENFGVADGNISRVSYELRSGWQTISVEGFTFINHYGTSTIDLVNYLGEIYVTNAYLGTSSEYCFNRGTKILCLVDNIDKYIPIEQLKKGDLVKTYLHGYRKIDSLMHSVFKNNINDFKKSMYVMPKKNDMTDDLIITGGHSILVDSYDSEEVKNEHKHLFGELDPIDDKFLLLAGKSTLFNQIQGDNLFDIYHLCLEGDTPEHDRRFGIWANGVLTESTYKKIIYDVIKMK